MAQSAEQYILNTYMYIEIMNVVKKKRKCSLSTQLDDVGQVYIYIYIYPHTHTHTYASAHTHTDTHTHTHHAHTLHLEDTKLSFCVSII